MKNNNETRSEGEAAGAAKPLETSLRDRVWPWFVVGITTLIYLIGRRLPIPGVELPNDAGRSWILRSLSDHWYPDLSLFGLGILWLVVLQLGLELFVTREHHDDLPKWTRLSFVAYLAISAIAAYTTCNRYLAGGGDRIVLAEIPEEHTTMAFVTLFFGSVVIWVLASWLTRTGIGHGALVLLAVDGIVTGSRVLWYAAQAHNGLVRGLVPALIVGVFMVVPIMISSIVMRRRQPNAWPVFLKDRFPLLSSLDYVMLPFVPAFVIWQLVPGALFLQSIRSLDSVMASWKVVGLPVLTTVLAAWLATWWRRRTEPNGDGHGIWPVVAVICVPAAIVLVGGGWVNDNARLEREIQEAQAEAVRENPMRSNNDHMVVLSAEDGEPTDAEIIRRRLSGMRITAIPIEVSPNRIVLRLRRVAQVEELMRSVLARSFTLHLVPDDQRPVQPRATDADLDASIRITEASSRGSEPELESSDRAALRSLLETRDLPEGTTIGFTRTWRRRDDHWRLYFRPLLVEAEPSMSLDDAADSRISYDETTGSPVVNIELGPRGTSEFAQLTSASVGRRLALIRGDEVLMAPLIQERVSGGRIRVDMGFRAPHDTLRREAQDMVVTLRSGVLGGSWRLVEARQL